MPADLTEAVRAAQAGDEEAFRFLYRAVQPGLLRYLTALVGADAEDVASETWLHISRDLRSFEGGPAFRVWAATIARNRALDHLRRHSRRPAQPVPAAALVELPSGDDTAERAGEQIGTDAAIALIATLPRAEAEAVLLRTVVGLDAKAAGRVLGKRAGAVRIAAHRGLRRLARMLEESGRSSRTGLSGPGTPPWQGALSTPAEPGERTGQGGRAERVEQMARPERAGPARDGSSAVEWVERVRAGQQNQRPELADFGPRHHGLSGPTAVGATMFPHPPWRGWGGWSDRTPARDGWGSR